MRWDVHAWWLMLCAVSALNLIAWVTAAASLGRRRANLPAETYRLRRLQLLLSAAYVLGCGFRSAFPVFDVPRVCLFDTGWSSVVVGRSVATVAELCFAAQWALLLGATSRHTGSRLGRLGAVSILPLIVLAEACSWTAVLTTSNLGHVAEESLWALSAALLVAGAAAQWSRCAPALRPLLAAGCLAGAAYVAYMVRVDVPMYWTRWLADEAGRRPYLSLAQGWLDVSTRRVVSTQWQVWHGEVLWMTLYFSVAVWTSIALVHTPLPSRRRAGAPAGAPS